MKDVKIEFKKPIYPVSYELNLYLEKYHRTTKASIEYDDLMRFSGCVALEDKEGNDTHWLGVYYTDSEHQEIQDSLNRIYTYLHSDGNEESLPYLVVDSIDYCTFGNSKPFRIRVRNILNDNYTNFYIKKADASRIYGLELEDILSPHRINFLVYKSTLIEEHILGIPGDVFIKKYLDKCNDLEKNQIAKEFVKFNERCFIGLLGDMRSYNYVIVPIHDFDQVIYRVRPIDFDQQCYEGNLKIYRPQYFKENKIMVDLVTNRLKPNSIDQYRKEVKSLISKRISNSSKRFRDLMKIIKNDIISTDENIIQLRTGFAKLYKDQSYEECSTMGEILYKAIANSLEQIK
ncbi:hypothetical protein HX001_10185 [Empedobacter brevis]|uniref:Uncharacterized protein n=1 Tax=Empedobacter brevis TaxID=247 RepID=A0AAJ1QF04_9FLAO|nr:hypothetical protein [Empedobacter brevis]MDM1072855.1 hypothetical protein [Empedobacter brevis]QHC84636.1 hypothetical protein AS589_07465 [Empedobacter brevis]